MFLCVNVSTRGEKIHLAEKTKRFDYENSLRPCCDSNPDSCTYFTLHYANRLLYHCAILFVSELEWPYNLTEAHLFYSLFAMGQV